MVSADFEPLVVLPAKWRSHQVPLTGGYTTPYPLDALPSGFDVRRISSCSEWCPHILGREGTMPLPYCESALAGA